MGLTPGLLGDRSGARDELDLVKGRMWGLFLSRWCLQDAVRRELRSRIFHESSDGRGDGPTEDKGQVQQ